MKPEVTCAVIGEGNLLLCCLEELLLREVSVKAVFSNTESVSQFCSNHRIKYNKRNVDLLSTLKDFEIDYLFSISNPRILKEDVLKLPRKLTINYHDSPLPAYAGVHATSWAILNGENSHGISWHVVEVGIDTGDILQGETVDILDDDSALTLNLKCVEASKRAFGRLADNILCNNVVRLKQPNIGRTYFGLYAIPPNIGLLKFTDDVDKIYNLARALEFGHHENALGSPKVKTSTGEYCLVTNAEKVHNMFCSNETVPGEILEIVDSTVIVATNGVPIALSLANLHGGLILEDSLHKYGLTTGQILGSDFDINLDDLVVIRKKESFWRRKCGHYEPTMFYRQKMNVVASIIEVCNEVTIKNVSIDLNHEIDEINSINDSGFYLQACFVAFLARINCTQSVNIGLLVDKKDIQNDCKYLYADIVPAIFAVDNATDVEEVLNKCHAELKQYRDSKTFLTDMFYRYPELRGHKRNPHHNIVLGSESTETLGNKQLQKVLQDCNVLLMFEGKSSSKVKVMYHDRPAQDFSHITEILQHFKTFLKAIGKCKEKCMLKNISLVDDNDKNRFYKVVPSLLDNAERDLSALLDCQCELTPLSIAVKTTSILMTYSKLSYEVSLLKAKLDNYVDSSRCGKPVIGLHMPNSLSYVVSVLAITKSNLSFLPLPVDIPPERACFTLKDAQVGQIMMTKDVFTKCDFNGLTVKMQNVFEHHILDERVVFVQFDRETVDFSKDETILANKEAINNNHENDNADFLYLMYTSGSTGRPKGVKVRESGVINLAKAQITSWDIVPGDVVAQFASIGFDASISEIFTALLSGATLAILGSTERLGSEFTTSMTQMKITTITLPPSALNIYSPEDLPSLQKVISAGESCTLNIAVKWTSSGVRFFNAYGPTEGTVCATIFEYLPGTNFEDVNRDLPIGQQIDGVQVYLFDDFMQPVPPGVVGEICIGGRGLAHGYIGHASKFTQERFVQNPLTNSVSKLYKTGDHAFQDLDGNITYIGRSDDQVKIRGHRIDLSEIEQVLIQHSKIEMAVVVVHKCPAANEHSVAAYVAPTFVYQSELREYLEKVLPKYMIPTYIKTVEVKDLPKTVNGKINRKKLEIDETVHEKTAAEGHSHLSDTQLFIAQLWCKVFKFDESYVYSLHRQSSFSELGGNSLQLVLLMRLLESELQIKLSFTDLGTADTIEEFSEVTRRRRDIKSKPEHNELKSRAQLREMIFHDSELESSININRQRRRSFQCSQSKMRVRKRDSVKKGPQNILLSGVTGFLGAFLLSEIMEQSNAHVCCMVRESTETRGFGRVIDNMRKYGLWKFEYASRIAIVLSDLSQENLGIAPGIYKSLCNAVDVVFMNAAMMNFNTPYQDHRIANVQGTKEFIKFATTGVQKYLFTTSSLSVFLFPAKKIEHKVERSILMESEFFDDPLLIEGGYGQSKWASERLVMQALDFLPGGAIFRPARVSGRSTDGVGPRNDLFASTLVGMKKMGFFPDMDFPYDLTPVDFCAKAMTEITLEIFRSDQIQNVPRVYHLFNSDTIPFKDLFDGMELQALPLEEWRARLTQLDTTHKELLPLTPFFTSEFWDRAPDWPVFDTANVDNAISDRAKVLLKPTKELLPVYKKFFGI